MHEAEDAEIPAIIWAVALVVVVTLLIFYHAKAVAARKVEIRKLQRLAAEELARAEEQAEEELSSMLAASNSLHNLHVPSIRSSHSTVLSPPPGSTPVVKQQTTGLCAVCSTPTKKQCSRCKAVKYCSHQCQVQHWRDGHKQECREQEKPSISRSVPSDDVSKDSIKDEKLEANGTNFEEQFIAPSNTARVTANGSLTKPSKVRQLNGSLTKPSKILFPYEDFVELFTWDGLSLPPCGLINCGNSCFANVVLQCLTYTRPLTAYLLQGIHSEECKRSGWCFMCELQTHVSRVRQSQNPFSPIRILSQIRNIGNHLGYGRQEDAHEFMRFAVDSMQSACLDKVGGEKGVDHRTQETTLIQHIFGGHLQSQVRCMQCHHESHRYENMMDLAVEIHGNVESLEDALTQFTAPEWLDGENKYKCDRCNAYVKAWKRLVIHEAPNILTIALKRFQSGKFGKLNKRVSFPEILDISPYMSGEGDKPPLYQLYGVIVHVDMLNASFFGHYICYVKDLQGCWYKMDDSKVKEVDIEKVLQQRGYMLLYSRSAARHATAVDGGNMRNAETSSAKSTSDRAVLSNGNHALPETAFSCEADRNGSYSCLPESNGMLSNGDSLV